MGLWHGRVIVHLRQACTASREDQRLFGHVDTWWCYCVHMADVGIRELKQRLSEYLDRAERGEVLRVTDRGRPKAILGPVPGRARVEAGIRDGWITPGAGTPLGPAPRWKASRRVLDVLAE